MRGAAQLDARGITGASHVDLGDVAAIRQQRADRDFDQRAKARRRLGRDALVE